MAAPPMYQAYGQNKGTLVPGQTITVNKYTVQVERYLSQGGFAHVYLVRTPTPVYNTTHHVLKRIAVSNETMLSEVRKEVDIMRLLKGHPNIVHLIDAAWHRMPNGLYEVFILMEFCSGGGIIDMMNRRLRERLTEAEILQIFVDVCEGVAYMHNSRPPLLHRDLKVENILQSSPTSFKLCDFGSATTVSKPPSTHQEIRALEADLNRHTTLQYRAPEMVDVYQKRPVDEKSDVWALGVLLYKLCYYTTPFEEHGPLAILNVQYRIPPYPVYSPQMNGLIASMLREHGHQRPSVFELLAKVHQLRGTKSPFQYTIPSPQPLSPRASSFNQQNALESTVTYRNTPSRNRTVTASPAKNPGVQARDAVLEAIEPMRRGRPQPPRDASAAPQASDAKREQTNFGAEEEKAWKRATMSNGKPEASRKTSDDPWGNLAKETNLTESKAGFGDDFGEKLWQEFDSKPKTQDKLMHPAKSAPVTKAPPSPASVPQPKSIVADKKDAFDGLGLMTSSPKPPTLGEARKLRTGLAIMGTTNTSIYDSGRSPRPKVSPQPSSYLASGPSQPQTQLLNPPSPIRPSGSGSSWSSQPPEPRSSSSNDDAETKFPSLEELDAKFATPALHSRGMSSREPVLPPRPGVSTSPLLKRGDYMEHPIRVKPREQPNREDPSRSSQGKASMKETGSSSSAGGVQSRPSLTRKHRSSISIKSPSSLLGNEDALKFPAFGSDDSPAATNKPTMASSKDWLTGDDSDLHPEPPSTPNNQPAERPILRQSPSKRASYIEKSSVPIQEASRATHDVAPKPVVVDESVSLGSRLTRVHIPSNEKTVGGNSSIKGSVSRESPSKAPPVRKATKPEIDSSSDEGPEDANGYVPPTGSSEATKPRRKGRQSSVHDLVDLYGGGKVSRDGEPEPDIIRPLHDPKPAADKALKRRSTAAPSTKPKMVSSPAKPMPLDMDRLSVKSPGTRKSPSPSSGGSSRSSRPQSLIVFPSSKSSETGAPPTPNLAPPAHRPRGHGRRSSITDMVQRFESMDAGPKNVAASAAATRSAALAKLDRNSPALPSPTLKLEDRSNNLGLPRSQDTGTDRANQVSGLPWTSPMSASKSLPASMQDHSSESKSPSPVERRQTRTDMKFPPIKPTPVDEPSQPSSARRSAEGRSSSPERPYQGVSKLIDQWQKKAEDEKPRGPIPKRGGFVAKRAGLVSGGSGRSQ